MMDDDDYPNFGNAFPTHMATSTPSETTSTSALKPKAHHRRNESRMTNGDDDFFERYPGPTPEKARRSRSDTDDESDSDAPRDHVGSDEEEGSHQDAMVKAAHVEDNDGSSVDDDEQEATHSNGYATEQTQQRSVTKDDKEHEEKEEAEEEGEGEDNDDNEINRPEQNITEKAISSGEAYINHDQDEEPAHQDSSETQDEHAALYEHQGELTDLEQAVDESVDAPLMEDEQSLPTIASISRAPTFQIEDTQPSRGVERSFTTNFTDLPKPENLLPQSVETSSEWPAVGDDKTFADLLDSKEPDVEGEVKKDGEQDLSAAFAAAFDDDDILEDKTELDPTSFFGDDDDDGFLDDEPVAPLPSRRPATQQRSASAYVPSTTHSSASSSFYGAPASPFLDQSHGRSGGTPTTGLYGLYSQPLPAQTESTRPALASAQSFVDKPKSGYQSPYDLPMEVVKTRKRPAASTKSSQGSPAIPPPRTSSFGQTSEQQIPASSPPNSSHGLPMDSSQFGPATVPAKPTPKMDSGFFADLPMTTKSRARPSSTYTPLNGMPTPPLAASTSQPQRQAPAVQAPPLRAASSYVPATQPGIGGLRQPEKVALFPEQITPPSTMQSQVSPPSNAARFSPAPVSQAPATSRYSPAPAGQPMKSNQRYSSSPSAAPSLPPARSQPFLPRTSSPLAVHGRPQPHSEPSSERVVYGSPGKSFDTGPPADRRGSGTSRYAPSTGSTDISENAFSPRRQRTQSPSEFKKLPALAQIPDRSAMNQYTTTSAQPQRMHLPHRRQFSREMPFAVPQDERVHDPLERWKGHPIFYWSPAGVITSSIPKQTPFYATGGATIKCMAGDIKISDASTVLALDERDAKFPGPLTARSKSKKKDLLSWMTGKIEDMRQAVEASRMHFEIPEVERRANEEKLILWQMMRIFLEHDGLLEGNTKTAEEVRGILLPDLAQQSQVMDLQSPISGLTGDTIERSVLYEIRQALLEGQREKAVAIAEGKRLWGHAMLIASTLGPDSFKQIVSSFVRSQVKTQGSSDFKSLAALYQVFAGNPEDCVDELVPPSARAGFQMISTADGRGNEDSLAGIDQWRETLSLVHSNSTPGSSSSLLAVGKLLASYGRVEAAHICFLFARSLAKIGGTDEQDADFVLFGVDAAAGAVDLDALMLTEIYEYASSLSATTSAVHYIPHLQAYKLVHARHLAAAGHKGQAQNYCDHIDAAIRSTTRPSGYYHQAFAQELIAFNALLSQTPHTGSNAGKFFSRPAMGKVSSGVGSWFTKFVSGEEGDTDSNTSGQGADAESFGPFGGVAANSGPISRTPSSADLYNAAPLAQPFQPASVPSRYTPVSQGAGKYAPSGYAATRTSIDSDKPLVEASRSASARYAPMSNGTSPALLGVQPAVVSRRASNQSLASTGSYEPKPALAEQDGFSYSPFAPISATAEEEPVAMTNGVQEIQDDAETGYAPPTMGYEAPTYQPWQPDAEEAGEAEEAPKPKKSYMDDDEDDDITARATALKPQQTSRDPDPAIVAAAAADAAREGKGHSSKESGSWFGGWFGKKDPNAAPGPIKAKLGEESSFYFDKDLNKWVNKKGGNETSASAASSTPPPPRAPSSAPPSRNVSTGAPMSGPPSRQSTPANAPPAGMPSKPLPGSMAPPPRPASSMSNASSLDDLLGGPAGGAKRGATKGKKKGRYVDVMANAS